MAKPTLLLAHDRRSGPELFGGLQVALSDLADTVLAPDLGQSMEANSGAWSHQAAARLREAPGSPSAVVCFGSGLSAALKAYADAPCRIIAVTPEPELAIPAAILNAPAEGPPIPESTPEQEAAEQELHRVWELVREGKPLSQSDHDSFADALVNFFPQELGTGSVLFAESIRLRAPDFLDLATVDWSIPRPDDPWEAIAEEYTGSLTAIRRSLAAPEYERWLDAPFDAAPDGRVITHQHASDYFWLDDPSLILAVLSEA